MPYVYDPAGYPNYVPSGPVVDDDYYLRPVVPSPRPSPSPSPHGSPNRSPMYLDENYNYYQPATGYVGVPMMPAGIMPLLPSPDMLSPMFVPLPPSPRVSPRMGPVPLSPASPVGMPGSHPMYPHAFPYDPYWFPQSRQYMNFQQGPRTSVNPILKDSQYIRLDLSSHSFAPTTPSGSSWVSRRYIPLHEGYLTQLAAYPPPAEIKIVCKALGRFAEVWSIRVKPGHTISVGDVLRTLYKQLYTQVTHAEWATFTESEVVEASRAYTRRCRTAEFERVKGVRRVDLLGAKHWFGALKKVGDDDPHNFELLVKAD